MGSGGVLGNKPACRAASGCLLPGAARCRIVSRRNSKEQYLPPENARTTYSRGGLNTDPALSYLEDRFFDTGGPGSAP
jgi:hypothetical protein